MSLLRPFSKLPGLNAANVLHDNSRPRIDLVVLLINLVSELSLQSACASLKHLAPGFFLGKVCFMVTNARNASVPAERMEAVRKLASELCCPLLWAEDQTPEGVANAAERLLVLLKVSAGCVPMVTALDLSNLTRCTMPTEAEQQNF
ncbi:hypothetical protein CRUP_019129 [Coryphaenoides rupestris]|nr:hypothetical protein CRUP_019129 [Coryphaenoides rupestris]